MSRQASTNNKSLFIPVPPPATKLGHYRQLASRAAIHVSPLCLGAMSIGDKWAEYGFGAMDKESSFKLLDAYFDAGGNFIDTANSYQFGSSERFIGEWAEARGIRDQLIIATKYSNNMHWGNESIKQHVNFVGNSNKSLKSSVESSLQKLRTSYIDILYVHFWDLHTSMEEVMDSLHNLIISGTVLYLGISDAPAWIVTKANEYACQQGRTPFVVYQAGYSILRRDIERDILPMCHHEGIALTLWGALAGGHIRTDEEEEKRRKTGENGRDMGIGASSWERTADEKKVCDALEVVAKQVGAKHITAVALSYTMHKAPYVFPVLGGRKVEHLHANIEALSISLTDEHIEYLESILPFDKGFPSNIFGEYGSYNSRLTSHATFDPQPLTRPVVHMPN
ncbi:aryl-alcohol dehydrogenase [Ramaria rubella]|nr:aryl-alcohol dehydrogenase [Ramaria rubella]